MIQRGCIRWIFSPALCVAKSFHVYVFEMSGFAPPADRTPRHKTCDFEPPKTGTRREPPKTGLHHTYEFFLVIIWRLCLVLFKNITMISQILCSWIVVYQKIHFFKDFLCPAFIENEIGNRGSSNLKFPIHFVLYSWLLKPFAKESFWLSHNCHIFWWL